MTKIDEKNYFTLKDIVDRTGWSESKAYNFCRVNNIKYLKGSRKVHYKSYFDKDDFNRAFEICEREKKELSEALKNENLIFINDFVKQSGYSYDRIRIFIKQGKIDGTRVHGKIFIDKKYLKDFTKMEIPSIKKDLKKIYGVNFITVNEYAEKLFYTTSYVRHRCVLGKIPSVKYKNRRMIPFEG